MSAIGGKADMTVCGKSLSQSLLGVSGHGLLQCKCPLLTQSGNRNRLAKRQPNEDDRPETRSTSAQRRIIRILCESSFFGCLGVGNSAVRETTANMNKNVAAQKGISVALISNLIFASVRLCDLCRPFCFDTTLYRYRANACGPQFSQRLADDCHRALQR
jgi:hypothetical protein